MNKETHDLKYRVRPANIRRIVATLFDGNAGEFADRIGRPRPNVYAILSVGGKNRSVGESLARDIETILGLDVGELDRPTDKPINSSRRHLDAGEREMLEKYRLLSLQNRAIVAALIASLPEEDPRPAAAKLQRDAGADPVAS